MKIKTPSSFNLGSGKHGAVLLLHGFTGSTLEVKKLGRHLAEEGYFVYSPLYSGHGGPAEQLLETSPHRWWLEAVEALKWLREEGYEEITVAGVSLGGLLALRLAAHYPVQAAVSMCAPFHAKNLKELLQRVETYAFRYKQLEGKNEQEISEETQGWNHVFKEFLTELQELLVTSNEEVKQVQVPTLMMQGELDEPVYISSAKEMLAQVASSHKELQLYKRSGHILTIGEEKEVVFKEASHFLSRYHTVKS
ncbi:alpha/beta hydrolase [Alkalicoccus daliensis]|uniref:Carboxylesterase n=1 Tax=Alkalicoccus daliensis TaxID=745820 RepID=A0A1H0D8Y3_9BACI|nr:alpha/beta fold hydrolase [Alkalicoccus daliensis]SDN66613.1 carboxylesterase [Alkalicoccus daliensis]